MFNERRWSLWKYVFWKHESVCRSSGCIYNMLSEKSASKSSFGEKMSGGDLWAARDSAWVNVHQIKKGWVLKTSRERERLIWICEMWFENVLYDIWLLCLDLCDPWFSEPWTVPYCIVFDEHIGFQVERIFCIVASLEWRCVFGVRP